MNKHDHNGGADYGGVHFADNHHFSFMFKAPVYIVRLHNLLSGIAILSRLCVYCSYLQQHTETCGGVKKMAPTCMLPIVDPPSLTPDNRHHLPHSQGHPPRTQSKILFTLLVEPSCALSLASENIRPIDASVTWPARFWFGVHHSQLKWQFW